MECVPNIVFQLAKVVGAGKMPARHIQADLIHAMTSAYMITRASDITHYVSKGLREWMETIQYTGGQATTNLLAGNKYRCENNPQPQIDYTYLAVSAPSQLT